MTDMNKINEEALEEVVGGKRVTVHNDAVNYANIRSGAGLNTEVLFRVKNGTVLETTGNKITRDGYTWYEVNLAGAYDYGWIAGSLIGY